jgi:pentalenolactone synthase
MYMQTLIDRKRGEPGHDVISDLLEAAEHIDGMGDLEVAQMSAGLLFAGHITTVNAIDEGVFLFLTHPDQREALVRDPSVVPHAVEEILRYPSPARTEDAGKFGLPRWAGADIEVDGVTIPAGDLVMLSIFAANLDEPTFPNACAFDVSRADNPHMTFGHGPRYCVGAPLARMELECVFGTLFQRFPTLELAVSPEEVVRRTNVLAGGFESLPVRWERTGRDRHRPEAGTAAIGHGPEHRAMPDSRLDRSTELSRPNRAIRKRERPARWARCPPG